MDQNKFDYLVHLLDPVIRKENTNYHDSVSSEERLVVTLRLAKFCFVLPP